MPASYKKELSIAVARLREKYPADFAPEDGNETAIAIEYLNYLDNALDHYKASFAMNESAKAIGK